MNLHSLLQQRASEGRPVGVVLIGAGKFGSMYLSQARRTPGIRIRAICDLAPDRARASLRRTGWTEEEIERTVITDDTAAQIAHAETEVVIDATGNPAVGVRNVLACCEYRKHVVMVNVEADALAGPLLARRAREAGIVYSLAYGDQPALICELVDWARAAGFRVVAAGKGTKYLPAYHASTPKTVWGHYGFSDEMVAKGDFNAQMFNSFLDGTKSAIEMAAVANATGLTPAHDGLAFPPCGVDDLPRILRPRAAGGSLEHDGQVEVISSVERDGRPVFRDLRWGVYVTFAAEHEYVRRCFNEYGIVTDPSGEYAAMYKPSHLIGLELGISVASVAVRREATGAATGWRGDAVATAKRKLKAGELLDGEGGYTVWGKLMSAADSKAKNALPIGLAHRVVLRRDVAEGLTLSWDDVDYDTKSEAVKFRREMEKEFA
jgi:predicted homoserine dehydrogenase-like protein